jgi:uncharacterized protein (TIRG00374 family)
MKRSLSLALKVAVLAVIFTIIFHAIDWRDSYSRISVVGETLVQVEGRIIGAWNSNSVRFLPDGASAPQIIRKEITADGTQTVVSPGFQTYLKNLDPFRFALGAMCFVLFAIIINGRWWWLLRANRLDVGFFEAQRFAWIGFFFNNVIPGTTGGDVVKAVYIAKRCSTDRVRALVSVVVDRIVGLLSLLLVGSLASLLAVDRFPTFTVVVWLTATGTLLFCVLLLSPGLRRRVRFEQLIARLPKRLGQILEEIDAAVLQYRDHLTGIVAWVLVSPLTYSLFIASIWFMDRSLGVGLALTDYFFIVPVASVVQGIPIAPAGWGIGEAVYGTLIGKFGAVALPGVPEAEQMMRTRGVALSILHRSHIVAWSLLGGVFMLIHRHKPTTSLPTTPWAEAQTKPPEDRP